MAKTPANHSSTIGAAKASRVVWTPAMRGRRRKPSDPTPETFALVSWESPRESWFVQRVVPYTAAENLMHMLDFGQSLHVQMCALKIIAGEDIAHSLFPSAPNRCRGHLGIAKMRPHPDHTGCKISDSYFVGIGVWQSVYRDFFVNILRGFPEFKP